MPPPPGGPTGVVPIANPTPLWGLRTLCGVLGQSQPRESRRGASIPILALCFVLFVVLGLPDGVVGTVWPTLRGDLGLAVGDLGWLVAARTVGFVAATVVSGHVTRRWGTSRTLLAAIALSVIGYVWMALAGNLAAVLAASVIAGAGSGWVDPVLNAWVALRHDARAMGLLHAFFGVGAAIGPPFATGVINVGWSWRTVFVTLLVLEVLLGVVVWWQRAGFGDGAPVAAAARREGGRGPRFVLGLMLAWFFLIVGTELSIGSWSFSLLVEERGVGNTAAAAWVAGFWVTFTAGRFAMGAFGDRLRLVSSLWGSIGITGVGAGLLWANPGWLPVGLPLPLIGAGGALLFPVMVLLTPRWLGPENTGVATGYQLTAASLGSVAFAVLIGRLADNYSLELLGPVAMGATVLMAVVLWQMVRATAATPGSQLAD